MAGTLDMFPTENVVLHKQNGELCDITALVGRDTFQSDDVSVVIEEGDIFERSLPNGAKEYYRVTDSGFVKGDSWGIPDHYQTRVEKISKHEAGKTLSRDSIVERPHKLFISHSSKDKEYMEAFVEMLEDIGMPDGSFICTSVPGHGIPGDTNIFDWLREQFLSYSLRMVFVLSKNYYASAASLNEMGAAWVTKATDTLLLLPGFTFNEISGCVDSRQIGISFDADEAELKHRLNEFKDTLVAEHSLPAISQARWERHRDKFIESVLNLASKQNGEEIDSSVGEGTQQYVATVGIKNPSSIPLEPAFLLVYAASDGGRILRTSTLGSPPQVSTAGKQFMADNSHRESARWQEALDQLVVWGWVKAVGSKGEIFELTGTGYENADWLKDEMDIDTDKDPIEQLKEFE